jgi:hypothetical protein
MRKSEFLIQVQMYASPRDYFKNKRHLDAIDPMYYDDYLDCLKCGITMSPASKALDKIVKMTRMTALSTMDIIKLIPSFKLIISDFDSCVPIVPQFPDNSINQKS